VNDNHEQLDDFELARRIAFILDRSRRALEEQQQRAPDSPTVVRK
jgi:hypothetical protein